MTSTNGILLDFIKPGDKVEITYVERGRLIVREGLVSVIKGIRATLTLIFDGGISARTLRQADGQWAEDFAVTGHTAHRTPGTWMLLNDEEILEVTADGFQMEYNTTEVTYSPVEGDSLVELIPKPTSQAFDMPVDLFEEVTKFLQKHGPLDEGTDLARRLAAIYGPSVSARRSRAFAMDGDPDGRLLVPNPGWNENPTLSDDHK